MKYFFLMLYTLQIVKWSKANFNNISYEPGFEKYVSTIALEEAQSMLKGLVWSE